jgi:hypothetical protein
MKSHQIILTLAATCLASAAFAGHGAPACSTSAGWGFVLPLNTPVQLQMFALLVSARANSQQISLAGNGLCDTYSDVETLIFVSY